MALTSWIVEIRTDECTYCCEFPHISFSFPLLTTHQRTALTDRHNSTYGKAEPEHADAINGGT
jgi:hypothetical protein